jgi:hypothetical protein
MIERVTFRFKEYGEVLVVTDDYAERYTIIIQQLSNCAHQNAFHLRGCGALPVLSRNVEACAITCRRACRPVIVEVLVNI